MWKGIGISLLILGTTGVLCNWMEEQKKIQNRVEEMIFFLQKTLYMMKSENVKILDYFNRFIVQNKNLCRTEFLIQVLTQVIERLSLHTYPNGLMVWEEVLHENEACKCLNHEVFQMIVQAGNGLFGKSKEENISFLQKSIEELEKQRVVLKEKNKQERKVWIPVGMLSTMMVIILFL